MLQLADRIASIEDFNRFVPDAPPIGAVAIKANVSSAHYWFIARGAGIGILPTYALALGGRVVPVKVEDVRLAYDIYLTLHPDANRMPRVRRLIDWLIEAFSPALFPWFRDEFLHPRDLPNRINDTPLSEMFDGFAGLELEVKARQR